MVQGKDGGEQGAGGERQGLWGPGAFLGGSSSLGLFPNLDPDSTQARFGSGFWDLVRSVQDCVCTQV